MNSELSGRTLVAGQVEGRVLVFDEPLSFWGGFDAVSGRVTDQRHPHLGAYLTGRVLVMPAGRGSSSASSVLAEAIRLGTAPAAIVLLDSDVIVALGAIIAAELYERHCPVVVLTREACAELVDEMRVRVWAEAEAARIVVLS
jgi:hypothetical protein